jgi:hypothetical protein
VRFPIEIRVAIGIIGAGAVIFLIVAMARGVDTLRLPIGAFVVAIAVALGLAARLRFARTVTVVVVMVLALLHVLVALSNGPWWVRAISGLLTAAYVYVAVLVNTAPAREYLEPK